MLLTMAEQWPERVAAFSSSPSRFLSYTTAEAFLAQLLRELRDDRVSDGVKVLLLSPLCELPTLLCTSDSAGEETAMELMSVFAQCSPKSGPLRCHLLLAVTSVLLCTLCASARSPASRDLLDLLLRIAQDTSDLHGDYAARALRATACECLRELEACCPGLLSQRLELLNGLRQREPSQLHQAYTGLHVLALRNAVYRLTQDGDAGTERLKALLGGSMSVAWEAEPDWEPAMSKESVDSAVLSSLVLGPMGTVPRLRTGPDCKEFRSVLSSCLEESYLLSPLSQAALLHRLTEVAAMVPGVAPAVFRAQLLRLLGTSEVCLFHATLLMKCAFTDSLFSAEDEAFLLKRLVALSQLPPLGAADKLFYLDCILHFPENRPIDCGDDSLPVLLTPRLALALAPTMFNDGVTMLARLNLLCLVYLEEGEDGEGGDGGGGLAYLHEHLLSLLRVVESGGSREIVVTFFRAAFLFLLHFHHVRRYSDSLVAELRRLYLRHTHLAPHLINLANQAQEKLRESGWAAALLRALQGGIVEAPLVGLGLPDLSRHLKVLCRVAEEAEISQSGTLGFLSSVVARSSSWSPPCGGADWRLGNSLLAVCRRVLVHPSLDSLLVPLADVLQHLTCSYGDTDVQDRARFYYTLLTTLSREKLAAVLEQGLRKGGRQVKKRSLSSIMAEGEGLTNMLTVHRTESTTLRMVAAQRGAPVEHSGELHGNTAPPAEALQTYRAQFSDSQFASDVSIRYRLAHAEKAAAHFDQLFSIRLHLGLTDEHYEELGDISVPCLFRDGPPAKVEVRLRPRRPHPTTLRASAIFTSRDGLSWLTALPDVHVAFQQVFAPLPSPPAWGRGDKLSLFQALWEEICGRSERDDPALSCATSLFCCQLKEAALAAVVKEHFQPFLLSDAAAEEFKVLFYLPPRCHILMKVRSEEDAARFDIATDDWKLLPHVSSYLLMVTSSPEDTRL